MGVGTFSVSQVLRLLEHRCVVSAFLLKNEIRGVCLGSVLTRVICGKTPCFYRCRIFLHLHFLVQKPLVLAGKQVFLLFLGQEKKDTRRKKTQVVC